MSLLTGLQYEDLKEVMEIEKEAFPDPWHVSFFKRQLHPRKKTHAFICCTSAG